MDEVEARQRLGWNDMFLLGHDLMDQAHRAFVETIGRLQTASDAELEHRLNDVIAHLEQHFRDEEASMRASAYPASACHAAEHAAVLRSGYEVRQALKKGDAALCRRYGDELANWFPGHTDYLDAPLAQWLSNRRFGAVPVVLKRGAAHT